MADRRATVTVNIADTAAVKAAILAAFDKGWLLGYGEGRDDEAAGLPLRTEAATVHGCPPDGSGFTPCCDRAPFELPTTDRMTLDPDLVTCGATEWSA